MYDSFRPFAPAPQPWEFQEVHCWNQHLWESVGMQARSDCNHVPHFKAFQLWLLLLPNVLTLKPVAVAGGRAASENMGIIWYDHHTPLWRQDMLKGFAFLQLNSSPFFSAEVSEVMCPHKLVSIQITWSIFSDSTGDMGQFLKEVLFPADLFFPTKFCFASANRTFLRTIERTPQTIRRSDNLTQVWFNDSVAKETANMC